MRKSALLRTFLKPRDQSMTNGSNLDKRPTNGKKAGVPVSKRKSGKLPERDELPASELGAVAGGAMDDPCAGGQYRGR
jgi:hypothetical protein